MKPSVQIPMASHSAFPLSRLILSMLVLALLPLFASIPRVQKCCRMLKPKSSAMARCKTNTKTKTRTKGTDHHNHNSTILHEPVTKSTHIAKAKCTATTTSTTTTIPKARTKLHPASTKPLIHTSSPVNHACILHIPMGGMQCAVM